MNITLVRAVQTSMGLPSSWNAWDTNGQYYYLRYRRSRGTVHSFPDEDYTQWSWDDWHNPVARFEYGNPMSGVITFDQFCRLAGLAVAPMIEYECCGRYFNGHIEDILKEIGKL